MTALWTWGGDFFGYRDDNNFWTFDGRHVGRFQGDEVYGPDGAYLGEIVSGNRLISCRGKRSWRRGGFTPYSNRMGMAPRTSLIGHIMYAGYDDIPGPKEISARKEGIDAHGR